MVRDLIGAEPAAIAKFLGLVSMFGVVAQGDLPAENPTEKAVVCAFRTSPGALAERADDLYGQPDFFTHLADRGALRRLPGLDAAAREGPNEPAAIALLDEQDAPVLHEDGTGTISRRILLGGFCDGSSYPGASARRGPTRKLPAWRRHGTSWPCALCAL
jgi:hypothetical protein